MRTFAEMFAEGLGRNPGTISKQASYSPFGFGRCVFPLFATDDDTATGLGTGFFIKDTDLGITAEHLMDVASVDIPLGPKDHELDLSRARHGATALLPLQGVIFGEVNIPPAHCQSVQRFLFDVVEADDPLAELQGLRRLARRSDVLFMEFRADAAIPPREDRPRLTAETPAIGDWVCAVGYPEIELLAVPGNELRMMITELGMVVSFARVSEVVMEGRTRHESAPIVLVESDWPAGMSGGPVFNSSGRVVGVVSRELNLGGNGPNQGSFTLLSHVMTREGTHR